MRVPWAFGPSPYTCDLLVGLYRSWQVPQWRFGNWLPPPFDTFPPCCAVLPFLRCALVDPGRILSQISITYRPISITYLLPITVELNRISLPPSYYCLGQRLGQRLAQRRSLLPLLPYVYIEAL